MDNSISSLFYPIMANNLVIKNRIVLPALATKLASVEGFATTELIEHYTARAEGGAGLIIVEGSSIHQSGTGFARQLCIYGDEYIPSLKKLATSVKSNGARIFIQLHHAGKFSDPAITGILPLAPSDGGKSTKYKEMSVTDIEEIVTAFGDAAKRAETAGFDGIEIHGAHDYIVSEFLSPYTNKRNDNYGGNFENRMRFPLEVIKDIRAKVSKEFVVSYRISAEEYIPEGLKLEDTIPAIKMFIKAGIDMVNVSGGVYKTPEYIISPMYLPAGVHVHLAEEIKKHVNIPVIAVGRIDVPDFADSLIASGKADMVAIGRTFLADSDWPEKVREGRFEDIRKCIGCNQGCIDRLFTEMPIVCLRNPFVGREKKLSARITKKNPKPLNIMVIGAGPAGMECARIAAEIGHKVMLCEKENLLGGQFNLAAVPPGKAGFKEVITYYEGQFKKLGVKVLTNIKVDLNVIKEHGPDVVIAAYGSKPFIPGIPGLEQDNVVTAHDVLAGNVSVGENVVILGGGATGCETAELLLDQRKKVTIIEMRKQVAMEIGAARKKILLERLNSGGADILTQAKVTEVFKDTVSIQKTETDGTVKDMKISGIETIVCAFGVKALNDLECDLEKETVRYFIIGDAKEPRNALEAIIDGANVAFNLS